MVKINIQLFIFYCSIQCLLILAKPTERIIGGYEADPGQFPYIVTITYTDLPSYTLCDGAILNEEWIVTTGHCVFNHRLDFSDILVGVGSNQLDTGVTYYYLQQVVVHPNFDFDTSRSDIALVRLDGQLTFSDTVQNIELGSTQPNDTVIIAGWGMTESETLPNLLYYAESKIISTDACTEQLAEVAQQNNYYLGEDQICTFAGEGEGICSGDAGGPVVLDGKLVGIISIGVLCGGGYPDVHTRVGAYADWINAVTGINS